MNDKTLYIRKGKNIKTIATGKTETFEYINEAKRKSRELQLAADGRLGGGSLVVE